jgi:hypothetical protein
VVLVEVHDVPAALVVGLFRDCRYRHGGEATAGASVSTTGRTGRDLGKQALLAPWVIDWHGLEGVLIDAQVIEDAGQLVQSGRFGDRRAFGVPHPVPHAGFLDDLVDQPPAVD